MSFPPDLPSSPSSGRGRVPPPRSARRLGALAALVGAFAIGAGLTAIALPSPQIALAPTTPAPIAAMRDGASVAIKGQVAEIFGNKFILQDEGGRALVDTGREGEGGKLVVPSETVTVQGRFDRGSLHATAVLHPDGRSDVVGPPGPPPHRGGFSLRGAEERLSRFFARHPLHEG